MVLQALEGRSDREAIDALRTDLRWKVAAGLALDHEGFHPTVLTLWRNKLRASESPERIFDAVRAVVAETGVLAGKTRRALDSTLLDDAVATQDTVTQLVSMIRRVRKAIDAAASVEVSAHDYDSPGKPACAWDDPAARDELITGLVNDALAILDAVEGINLDEQQQQLVALLALVAGQDVEPDPERGEGTWRIVRGVASERVISTVDPESRHMHKSRSSYRDGYKAHVAVEPDTGIITGCDLTPANTGDGPVGARLLEDEDPGLDVLADSAYGSGPVRANLAEQGHTSDHQALAARPEPEPGCRPVPPRRLRHRLRAAHRHLPGRTDRRHHHRRQRRVRMAMRHLSEPAPLHHRLRTARRSRPPNTTSCSPPPAPTGGPAPTLPTTASTGPWSNVPSPGLSPTATDESASTVSNATDSASATGRHAQPATPPQPGPPPRPDRLGHHLNCGSGEGKAGTAPMGSTQPGRPAHTLFTPALRFGHFSGPLPSLEISCSALS